MVTKNQIIDYKVLLILFLSEEMIRYKEIDAY